MINVNEIINKAVESNASDIHFISGLKPTLRINRDLIPIEDEKISAEIGDVRLRVNVSYSNAVPVITTRIIRNTLPRYEDLGVPDIVRKMTEQPQGLILVTGKTNSGKSTTLNALINYINETQNRKI